MHRHSPTVTTNDTQRRVVDGYCGVVLHEAEFVAEAGWLIRVGTSIVVAVAPAQIKSGHVVGVHFCCVRCEAGFQVPSQSRPYITL
jgi:hypothetical protein